MDKICGCNQKRRGSVLSKIVTRNRTASIGGLIVEKPKQKIYQCKI